MVDCPNSRFANLSEYDLRHLTAHLSLAGQHDKLYKLVEDQLWSAVRYDMDFTQQAFAQDVEIAIQCAESQGAEGIPRVIAYSLVASMLQSSAEVLPIDVLRALVLTGHASQALQYARMFGTAETRARAEWQIGDELLQRDDEKLARVVLREAVSCAESIPEDETRIRILSGLARSLVRAGLKEEGCQAARTIVVDIDKTEMPEVEKANALAKAARTLLEAGFDDEGGYVVQLSLDCLRQYIPNIRVGLICTLKDYPYEGIAILQLILILCEILGRMGRFKDALLLADKVRVPILPIRAVVLSEVARAMWKAGHLPEAREIAKQAVIDARRPILWPYRAELAKSLTATLAEMGESEEFRSIVKHWRLGGYDWAAMALELARQKHLSQSRELALHAYTVVRGNPAKFHRLATLLVNDLARSNHARDLARTAQALARVNAGAQAKQLAVQSIVEATKVKQPYMCGETFATLAVDLAQSGLPAQATQAVQLAISANRNSAPNIMAPGTNGPALSNYWRKYHVDLLSGLAQALAYVGQTESTEAITTTLLKFPPGVLNADSLAVQVEYVVAHVRIVQALARSGDLRRALSVARGIRGIFLASSHVRALCVISRAMVSRGRVREAQQILQRARTIESNSLKSSIFHSAFLEDPEDTVLLIKVLGQVGEIRSVQDIYQVGRSQSIWETLAGGQGWSASDHIWTVAEIAPLMASTPSAAQQLVQHCITTCGEIQRADERWLSLIGAAHALAQFNDLARARRYLRFALASLDTVAPLPRKGWPRLGQTLAEISDIQDILASANKCVLVNARDELLSGAMRALILAGEPNDAAALAQRIAAPAIRADALAMLAESVCASHAPDKLGYLQLLHQTLRAARTEDRQSVARHISALLPGVSIFGRDTVVATWQQIQSAERFHNLELSVPDNWLGGNTKAGGKPGIQVNKLTSGRLFHKIVRGLYSALLGEVGWFVGCIGWLAITAFLLSANFQMSSLSRIADTLFQSKESTTALLAFVGALLLSIRLSDHLTYHFGSDLLRMLGGVFIPGGSILAGLGDIHRLPSISELGVIVFTSPVLALPLSVALNTSVSGLVICFCLSFVTHMWLLSRLD